MMYIIGFLALLVLTVWYQADKEWRALEKDLNKIEAEMLNEIT